MTLINKYIWVVNALDRAGRRGLTFKELNEKWQNDALCSQEEIKRQTFDFLMELLRYGTMIEVLMPKSIRETMRSIGQELIYMYKND